MFYFDAWVARGRGGGAAGALECERRMERRERATEHDRCAARMGARVRAAAGALSQPLPLGSWTSSVSHSLYGLRRVNTNNTLTLYTPKPEAHERFEPHTQLGASISVPSGAAVRLTLSSAV